MDGGPDGVLNGLTINLTSYSNVNSVGYLSDTVFSDGSAVGLPGNYGLGVDADIATPTVTGTSSPSFVTETSAVKPIYSFGVSGNSVSWLLEDFLTSDPLEFSSVLFFTSDQGPAPGTGTTFVPPANGSVPIPVPAPSSFTLIMMGIPLLLAAKRRRNKKKAEADINVCSSVAS